MRRVGNGKGVGDPDGRNHGSEKHGTTWSGKLKLKMFTLLITFI